MFRGTPDPTTELLFDLPDLVLVEGTLTGDGTFSGDLEVDATDPDPGTPSNPIGNDVGDFAGVIGGTGGAAMAGGLMAQNFTESLENEIEYGVFVLDLCVAGNADPICANALSP